MRVVALELLWSCAFLALGTVQAFPSWLKCYVDLDETEIIMGGNVKTFDQAAHKVILEVREEGTDEWHENYSYSPGEETLLQVRLKIPEGLSGTVQWAIDTTEGGTFVNPSICDGKRSFSDRHDTPVSVKITGEKESVSLWAGWATGKHPVSLTQKLVVAAAERSADEL